MIYEKKNFSFFGPNQYWKNFHSHPNFIFTTNGVIGFPLRLLARENYERAKKTFDNNSVALITGEEKIIPKNARYFFCTVESIPKNINFEFVAIDEVQMASDYDRGYIFGKNFEYER